MASSLDILIGKFGGSLAVLTNSLKNGDVTPAEWEAMFRTLLRQYHLAAFALGGGDPQNKAQMLQVTKDIGIQGGYLRRFSQLISESEEWQDRWESRAVMYAESVKTPYWRAATGFASLPALPGQGTACLTNCRCSWRSREVGNGLITLWTWERFSRDSCHTCVERGLKWVDLPFMNGVPLQG